ncbi:MAG: PEP-CTERM sorting domain-containing protein [Sphingomonadaceae bacterium]
MKKMIIGAALALGALSAQAASFTVDAKDNSSSGGTALATITLTAGQAFNISSSTDDLWSAGALPRWSDANGLIADRFATGADESGEAFGTQIGSIFSSYSQNGHSAAYGALVGEIGGQWVTLGANYSGVATASGTLNLYYWDSNNGDNTGAITFNVSAVPEPSTYLMLGAGLMMLTVLRKRKA